MKNCIYFLLLLTLLSCGKDDDDPGDQTFDDPKERFVHELTESGYPVGINEHGVPSYQDNISWTFPN